MKNLDSNIKISSKLEIIDKLITKWLNEEFGLHLLLVLLFNGVLLFN